MRTAAIEIARKRPEAVCLALHPGTVKTGLSDPFSGDRERIEPATKREFDTARIQRYNVQYQWFAGIALALLLVESCIGARRAPRRGVVPAFPEASA